MRAKFAPDPSTVLSAAICVCQMREVALDQKAQAAIIDNGGRRAPERLTIRQCLSHEITIRRARSYRFVLASDRPIVSDD